MSEECLLRVTFLVFNLTLFSSLPTDFLHSTSCVCCPSNTPLTTATRSSSSSSSNSISTSTKSCTCSRNKPVQTHSQPQRSQSSPARPSSTALDESKRSAIKPKVDLSSFLRMILVSARWWFRRRPCSRHVRHFYVFDKLNRINVSLNQRNESNLSDRISFW